MVSLFLYSAFICSLSVVVVPLINGLFGRTIRREVWVASLLAVVGVGLLTLQGKNFTLAETN